MSMGSSGAPPLNRGEGADSPFAGGIQRGESPTFGKLAIPTDEATAEYSVTEMQTCTRVTACPKTGKSVARKNAGERKRNRGIAGLGNDNALIGKPESTMRTLPIGTVRRREGNSSTGTISYRSKRSARNRPSRKMFLSFRQPFPTKNSTGAHLELWFHCRGANILSYSGKK